MDGEFLVVKKYSNRRLYDTTRSQHITLEELARLVRGGAVVKVIDATTGADLTRQVLTQAILDQQSPLTLIPVELLHAILKYQGTIYQAAFSSFLGMVMKQFLATGKMWERQIAKMLAGMTRTGEAPQLASPPARSGAAEPNVESADGAGEPPPGAERSDIQGVREQLRSLLGRLGDKG